MHDYCDRKCAECERHFTECVCPTRFRIAVTPPAFQSKDLGILGSTNAEGCYFCPSEGPCVAVNDEYNLCRKCAAHIVDALLPLGTSNRP